MIGISKLAASVRPSATLAAGARAKELKAQGHTIYDFSLGEPDFNTPKHIIDAATAAMHAGHTHYTPAGGCAELKQAICGWYSRLHGYEFGPECVMASNGAKHALHNVFAALVGPGDEVIIPVPYWVSYGDLVELVGAKPVYLQSRFEAGFRITPAELKAAITPRTRIILLNSPCNPSGVVYPREELEVLVDLVAQRQDIAIISDEIYEHLTYGSAKSTCVAMLRPWLRERTLTISGASKSFAMTGWRLGWTIGPAHIIKAMDAIQSQETACPSSVSQAAMAAALNSPESLKSIATMRDEFAARRDLVIEKLGSMPGLRFHKPQGAFYAFFDVSSYFGKKFNGVAAHNSEEFCKLMLDQARVNMVPGDSFGVPGFARMSFATNREEISAGLDAMKAWLATGA